MASTTLILCDCLGTQAIDRETLERTTGLPCSAVHRALCTEQAAIAQRAIQAGGAIIACGQERHFFEEMADALDADRPAFIDLRDRAGWSDDPRPPTPKMAALIADAMLDVPPAKAVDVESAGVCLIVGDAEAALDAARQLCEILTVTVLLAPGADPGPGDERRFDIVFGRLARARGALGGFEVTIDALQERVPGGRGEPAFTAPRNGARSNCDLILDLSGGTPLFPAPGRREGYLRADPASPGAKLTAILQAAQGVGTFEKPLYVRLDPSLCAHSRAHKTGCTRCLDLCPTGALSPAGDHVAVDTMVCAGCGQCSAVCPSGAIAYDAPPVQAVFRRIEALAAAWRGLAESPSRLLVHDAGHGAGLIRLSARHGRGLPADVIPLEVPALAAFGHAEALAALGAGFSNVDVLLSPDTEREGLPFQASLANEIAGREAVRLIEPADPDALDQCLAGPVDTPAPAARVLALGARRQVARLAARALRGEDEVIALPAGAPYGNVVLDRDACTLCLSCVSLCPSGALADHPDSPQLRFQEEACLQCGICVNACPERALTLEPRLNLAASALAQQVLHEEEPFACIECGTPFGVRSTVMRITEKLAGKHAMFGAPEAIRRIQMCDDCRVKSVFAAGNDPFAAGERPRVRTTADYLPPTPKDRKH